MNVNKKMTNKSDYLVKLENAGIYKSSKWLVRGVSLEVSKGQIVTLIGPNGSGKTTTAKMVLNILRSDEGSVKRNTNRVAYVPQKVNVDWTLPLRVFDFMKITGDISKLEMIEKLKLTGVEDLIYADLKNLSGGELRRVALCRLLLKQPDILLLDEPTNHLDTESVYWLEQHLQQYAGTVIAITHDRYFLDNVAGWILELDRGQGLPWKGNYSSWLDQKSKRLAQEEKTESKRRKSSQ